MKHVIAIVAAVAVLGASVELISAQGATAKPPAQGATAKPPAQGGLQRPRAPRRSPGAGPIIVFDTVKGSFEIETYPNEAPKTVEHILALVKRNFYNGLRIHRYEPGFVVQWGDPQTRDMTKKADLGYGRQREGNRRRPKSARNGRTRSAPLPQPTLAIHGRQTVRSTSCSHRSRS